LIGDIKITGKMGELFDYGTELFEQNVVENWTFLSSKNQEIMYNAVFSSNDRKGILPYFKISYACDGNKNQTYGVTNVVVSYNNTIVNIHDSQYEEADPQILDLSFPMG